MPIIPILTFFLQSFEFGKDILINYYERNDDEVCVDFGYVITCIKYAHIT